MTDIEALITAARHYCLDNFRFWADKYANERSGNNNPYSDNDYNIFPRYNALTAIRQGVESIVGKSFSSFESCKQELKVLAQNSHTIFTIDGNEELKLTGESGRYARTSGRLNPIAKSAILDERNRFVNYIDTLTPDKTENVVPLPYRRRLNDAELLEFRQRLLESWNYEGGYWEPLDSKSPKETIFLMKENITQVDYEKIIQLITEKSERRIFEISEDRIDYEIEIDSFDPDCYETIFTDESLEWVIYGSHESTIAFGGVWLIEFIKQVFADRQDKLNKWEQN